MDSSHPLQVVTPTLDGDVLTHLALTEASFSPGQLARILPKGSVEGVRKVLHRLTEQGIVTATRAGDAAVLYALNRDHLGADAVVALAHQATTLRERLEQHLARWEHPPVHAALFGSWARGTATVGSDVDVFLVRPADVDDDAWDAQVDELRRVLTRWTGNDARPFVVDKEDLPRRSGEPILRSVRDEGITVHGDPAWLRTHLRTRSRRGQGS